MATLYDRLTLLCSQKGIKGGKMCTDLGLSKSLMTDLKMGRKKGVNADTAQKIASYFGVSVGYLIGVEQSEQNETPPFPNEENKQGVMNRNIIRIAGRDGSFQEHHLSDGQLAAIKAILDQLPDASDDL